MNAIYYDPPFYDERRRGELYHGQLLVYSPRRITLAFVEFAGTLIKEAFAPYDPETAQQHLFIEQYSDLLGKLKPNVIHHPQSKVFIRDVLDEMGCDLEMTYFDLRKMRSSTSDNYLTTGIANVWHPYPDTRCSAPPCQINW